MSSDLTPIEARVLRELTDEFQTTLNIAGRRREKLLQILVCLGYAEKSGGWPVRYRLTDAGREYIAAADRWTELA